MKKIQINCVIECLEDFHIGTGSGNIGLYDDGQLKDRFGFPQINSSTIKGLLRDSCSQLDRMRTSLGIAATSWYERVFKSYEDLNSLDILVEAVMHSENPTIIHYFTAVDNKKRKSLRGSLRSLEFGSRGAVFKLQLSYITSLEETDSLMQYLIDGLYNIKALGGHRRRGFGAISVSGMESSVIEITSEETLQKVGSRVELVLELENDTILSSKAQSGNLLFTNDYIPGSTILGLLRSLALKGNCKGNFLDDGNLSSSFFYPLPDQETLPFELKICPVPLSLRRMKLRKSHTEDTSLIPVWALDMGKSNLLKQILSHNILAEAGEEQDAGKGMYDGYLYAQNNDPDWEKSRYFTVPKVYHQRNFVDRDKQSTGEDGIFIEEKIAAKTRFMGSLTFGNDKLCSDFLSYFEPWLKGIQTVHLGKGGKIARICDYRVLPVPARPEVNHPAKITLTLLSDAVLPDSNLNYAKTISPELLAETLGEGFNKEDFVPGPYIALQGVVSSFSGTSGLRKFRDIAIRKGSVFSFEYKGDNPELLSAKLNQLEVSGIGLRRNEGFGEIAVNHPLHLLQREESERNPTLGNTHLSLYETERLQRISQKHKEAQKLFHEMAKVDLKRNWRSMAGDLILDFEANISYQKIIQKLQAKMDQNSAHGSWKPNDTRYQLAEIIIPRLLGEMDRATLSEAFKLLSQGK